MPSIVDKLKSLVRRSPSSELIPYEQFVSENLVGKDPSSFLTVKGWEELSSMSTSLTANGSLRSISPTITAPQAVSKYMGWVYPCVNLIQKKVSEVNFYLAQDTERENEEGHLRVTSHPLIHMLRHPNKFYSGAFLAQITQMYLDLCGCAFWVILRNAFGEPRELHFMNPLELVTVELGDSNTNLIKKFVFAPLFQRQFRREYFWEDIVYFHYPHPKNPLAPFTPIQAMAHFTDLDLYMQVYQKDFFQNGATPQFVIVSEIPMKKEQAERLLQGWDSKHRGLGRNFRPAILSRNVRIEQVGMSAKDFEFASLADWSKKHILAAYGVPEAMFGLYEGTSKQAQLGAETTFVKNCINLRLRTIADAINIQLLPQFANTKGYEFRHESALPKDDEWALAEAQGQISIGLRSINEVRRKQGIKPWKTPLADVPWVGSEPLRGENPEADKLWDEKLKVMSGQLDPSVDSNIPSMQGSMGQLGGRPEGVDLNSYYNAALRNSQPGLATLINAARGTRGGLASILQTDQGLHSLGELLGRGRQLDRSLTKYITRSPELLGLIEKAMGSEEDKFILRPYYQAMSSLELVEERYIPSIVSFFEDEAEKVSMFLKQFGGDLATKDPNEEFYDFDIIQDIVGSSEASIQKACEVGTLFGLGLIEKGTGKRISLDTKEMAKRSAGMFLHYSADLRGRSMKKSLVSIIRKGIDGGLSIDEISDLIRAKFKDMSAERATRIARTETMGALNQALDITYQEANRQAGKIVVKRGLSWASGDDRVCDDPNPEKNCQRWHGEPVVDYLTGKRYASSCTHHVLCRCVLYPEFA